MKHIHFIGICGVGMSSLAILWQKKDWKVTGSDVGFFPPISTHLKKHNINFYPGWHPEKIGRPDLVVVGNVAGSQNPEWIYIQKNKIPFVSYPELIAKYLVKENSIVCAGTYGKTSNTTLLTWIFKNSGREPAYMFGGIAQDIEESAGNPENTAWSILEGDEYKTARWDNSPKFSHYKPTHLLLTAVEWDHADIYPTEENYISAFEELVSNIPKNGLIVINIDKDNTKNITKLAHTKIVTYGKNKNADYRYSDIKETKKGQIFTINNKEEKYIIEVKCYGTYMIENICGCFALCKEIGISTENIIKSIANFNGIKRRLEKRGTTKSKAIIFDDIAHSPAKAKSTLNTLRKIFNKKIYAIFEPNTGSRQIESSKLYDESFAGADEIIIPHLTKLKTKKDEKHMDGRDVALIIAKTHPNTKYMENDDEIINYLNKKTQPDDVIVFLGSHSFRGMIEMLTNN